jgi:hypothetical protein
VTNSFDAELAFLRVVLCPLAERDPVERVRPYLKERFLSHRLHAD